MIYLDYSANTPVDPAVLDVYCKTEQMYIANPNSTHCAGQAARAEMARVTESIARLLGVQPAEIIYTSGASPGTSANTSSPPNWSIPRWARRFQSCSSRDMRLTC